MSHYNLDPARITERRHTRSAVGAAVLSLPPLQRELIVLTHYQGQTIGESARRLGISPIDAVIYLFWACLALQRQFREWA